MIELSSMPTKGQSDKLDSQYPGSFMLNPKVIPIKDLRSFKRQTIVHPGYSLSNPYKVIKL